MKSNGYRMIEKMNLKNHFFLKRAVSELLCYIYEDFACSLFSLLLLKKWWLSSYLEQLKEPFRMILDPFEHYWAHWYEWANIRP